MHDEFRVAVKVNDPRALISALKALELGEQALRDIGRLAVTHEDDHVFFYADSPQAAEHAAEAARGVLAEKGLLGEVEILRWHPLEERWEDASAPLPTSEGERTSELARREDLEEELAANSGHPEWEVRITMATHHQARSFAERLQSEGIPVKQRWRYVLVGAASDSQALELAERLRSEAPAGSQLEVEGSGLPIWDMLHAPARPFAFFGGLAQ
jgi:hypothetical protein